MIGRLRGKLLEKQPPELLLDVNGVGYEIHAPMTTFYKLPDLEQEVILYTQFIVREDAQLLYGFATLQDRALFRELIKVNGVGPKLALTVLSNFEPNAFVQCILCNDEAALVRIPGVGKKTAQRLMVEMQDRLKNWYETHTTENTTPIDTALNFSNPSKEAISALVALGYKPQEASRVVSKLKQDDLSSEQMIRLALQHFAN